MRLARDRIPEELRHVMEAVIAGNLIASCRADDLGHVGVHVQPGQMVLGAGQRIEHALLGEAVADRGPSGRRPLWRRDCRALPACRRIRLPEWPAAYAPRSCPRSSLSTQPAMPVSTCQRLGVARQRVHVVEARQHLVHGVERRPDIDGVLVEPVVEFGGIGAEIAALVELCLALGQARHQRVAALFQFRIAALA